MCAIKDVVIEIQEFGIDTYGLRKKCSMCLLITDNVELADNDGKCKFCWRKGRTAGISNMGISRATAEHRLDNHQSRLDR